MLANPLLLLLHAAQIITLNLVLQLL